MAVSRVPAGYWLLAGLGVVSVGLIGMLLVPRSPPCLTDGMLAIRVADTVWTLPEKQANAHPVKRHIGYGQVCEPADGPINADHLSLKNVEPRNVHISISPYRGGTEWTQKFQGRCSKEPFLTFAGKDLGHQCNAYRALAGTTVRITYYSAEWPPERWPELFQMVDLLISERTKT